MTGRLTGVNVPRERGEGVLAWWIKLEVQSPNNQIKALTLPERRC
jgi:hypothetical protein